MGKYTAPVAVVLMLMSGTATAAEAEAPTIDDLAWMSGNWQGHHGGADIQEVWLTPGGDQMIGINRTLLDGETVAFEYLRIESDGEDLIYLASPGGRCPATSFRVERLEGTMVVFVNPEHDFPQRIVYIREDNTLHARIEGPSNGSTKTVEWSWTLAPR